MRTSSCEETSMTSCRASAAFCGTRRQPGAASLSACRRSRPAARAISSAADRAPASGWSGEQTQRSAAIGERRALEGLVDEEAGVDAEVGAAVLHRVRNRRAEADDGLHFDARMLRPEAAQRPRHRVKEGRRRADNRHEPARAADLGKDALARRVDLAQRDGRQARRPSVPALVSSSCWPRRSISLAPK